MKKIFFIFSLVFIFNSCDDGDIKLESFNFTGKAIKKCTDPGKQFLYKINNNELLLLNITSDLYTYDATYTEFPYTKTYPIDLTTTSVIYRLYSDTVSATSICDVIAPATPVVTSEWKATGGTVSVTTTQKFDTDGITLLGYNHTIKLLNINFASPSNSFSFEEYLFGDYSQL